MGKIAFVFPGQGAQHPGMGRELYEVSPGARKLFGSAEALRPGTLGQCFAGAAEELLATATTQPCLFCADLAAAAALSEAGIDADLAAGFSLGELAALTYAGVWPAEQGFATVCCRGLLMQAAAEKTRAGMLAVLKLDQATVAELCSELNSVYPVNFNCPGQVVVAGYTDSLNQLKALVKQKGGRTVPLAAGGGFHSPLMADAAARFAAEIPPMGEPAVPVYANATALPYQGDMPALLARQICSPVLWQKSVENMLRDGAEVFIEVGPGKVLSGLISRIAPQALIYNVEDAASLKKTIEEVRERA